MSTTTIDNGGERMVPELHRPSLMYAEHVTRYAAARDAVRGRRVLDIASGSGYGSHLLSADAASVVGVDVNPDAVAYASRTYRRDNLEFRVGDAERIPLDDDSVDVVVTFETIEHVADYRQFLSEIDRVLAPGGVALISTPNDLEFVEGNHFHLHEFVYDELLDLVGTRFAHVQPYFQATWKAVAIGTEEMLSSDGPVDVEVLNLGPLKRDQFLYFYFVCSREPVDVPVPSVVALGGHYSDRALQLADLRILARVDELETELAAARAESAALRSDIATLNATSSFRVARKVSGLARRLGRRPR